ncbi:MAG: hypothetical protein LBU32_16770 [Clostridiales bacterium]|jgi:hypothetical protein|nr:hypothetical protein [Clostridiales bacterium]
MNKKARGDLSLFKFSVIEELVNGKAKSSTNEEYYRQAAEKKYSLPDGSIEKFSPNTIKFWHALYMKGGLEALKPKGQAASAANSAFQELVDAVGRIRDKDPYISNSRLYNKLVEDGFIQDSEMTLPRFSRLLKANTPRGSGLANKDCASLKALRANDCWQADFSRLHHITVQGEKKKIWQYSFIDAKSHYVTFSECFFSDNAVNMHESLRNAILEHGIPKTLIIRNAKYVNNHLHEIVSSLGISLAIEDLAEDGNLRESFSNFKKSWMDSIEWSVFRDLASINEAFKNSVSREYNFFKHPMSGLSSHEIYTRDQGYFRKLSADDLDCAFMRRIERTAGKDGTIRINDKIFSVPETFINKKAIAIYHPFKRLSEAYIIGEEGEKFIIHPAALGDVNEIAAAKEGNKPSQSRKKDCAASKAMSFTTGFEAGGARWLMDFSRLFQISLNGEIKRVWLASFIDVKSQFALYSECFFSSNSSNMREALRNAILAHGIPEALIILNSKYKNKLLESIFEKLGISLEKGGAYEDLKESFKKFKKTWMDMTEWGKFKDLASVSESFNKSAAEEYNARIHSESGLSSYDIFSLEAKNLRRHFSEEIDAAFLNETLLKA